MSMRSKIHLLIFSLYLSILRSQTGAQTHTWVGSKYQIECTMCATCDNPCNTPSQAQPPPSPPPPSPSSNNNNYHPPSSGGNNYYYYPPPSTPSQTNYYYPPPYGNYPTPTPPNPITGYFPFYYHTPPHSTSSASSLSIPLDHATVFLIITTLFTLSCFL